MDKRKKKQAKKQFSVLEGEGRRFSFSRFKQAFIFYVLLLLALVVIVQVGYHWLGEQFLSWRLQVVAAKEGVIEHEKEVSGLITRKEHVLRAPDYGVIIDLAAPGERVPAGKEIATLGVVSRSEMQQLRENGKENDNENTLGSDLTAGLSFKETIDIESDRAGFLSTYLDGWEKHSGPHYLSEEEAAEKLEAGNFEGFETEKENLVDKGEPILKIVDNWQWYYNIVLPLHPGRSLTEEKNVEFEFAFFSGERISAELYYREVDEEAGEVRLTYLVEKQIPGFEKARWTEASLLYSRHRGIIIPEEAVFEKDGRRGVYLNQGGRVVFNPVSVLETKEEQALVEGLKVNSMVITRPDLVEEGQRLN